MQIDPDALPNDPAALQQMLRELRAENDKLRLLLERLMRHQFGRRSEQLTVGRHATMAHSHRICRAMRW